MQAGQFSETKETFADEIKNYPGSKQVVNCNSIWTRMDDGLFENSLNSQY
jgi:hypothetical protein